MGPIYLLWHGVCSFWAFVGGPARAIAVLRWLFAGLAFPAGEERAMDIVVPLVQLRAGPPPRLDIRRNVDTQRLIRKAIEQCPQATVNEIADILVLRQALIEGVEA